jgi:long-subunit fatty acid transport protein
MNVVGWTAALTMLSSVCSAQTVTTGTFQVSGVTSVLVNRQTITPPDSNGGPQANDDVNLTLANLGLEGTYYITPRFGIGALVSYQRVSAEASAKNALFRISGGFYGPLAQVRLPLGERSDFVLVGSGGGVSASLVNQNTGVSRNVAESVDGKYWLAGGGLSFLLNPNASFDLGGRYQSSTFSQGSQGGTTTAAGLLVVIAFSLYRH